MLLNVEELRGRDELLGDYVTEALIAEAEEYIQELANEFNVLPDAIKATYHVKQMLAAYVFKSICIMKSFGAPSSWNASNDGGQSDSYSAKYKFYSELLSSLERSLTEEKLTGAFKQTGGYGVVELYRG